MQISGRTRVAGIMGFPVEHSLSPVMHNAAFDFLGLDWIYVSFPVPPLFIREAVEGIRALGIAGVNVTVPYKETIIPYLDSLSQDASLFGAVNTIKNKDGYLMGYNTDGEGFLISLRQMDIKPDKMEVVVFGAGGAARAIVGTLAMNGAKSIHIVNRTEEKAVHLVGHFSRHFPETKFSYHPLRLQEIEEILPDIHMLINATTIGLKEGDHLPISFDRINRDAIIADIVYKPSGTDLLREAEKHGFKTLSGEGMLLYQGALSFEIWTGRKAPISIMKTAIKQYFS